MPRGRTVQDSAEKYRRLLEQYGGYGDWEDQGRLSQAALVTKVLRFAIVSALPGFRGGDRIGVAAAAEGFATSRTTVSNALGDLAKDHLIVERRNSPYEVIPEDARLPTAAYLAQSEMSITRSQVGASWILPGLVEETCDGLGGLLRNALERCADQAVVEVLRREDNRRRWYEGPLHRFTRGRYVDCDEQPTFWLVETTFLLLPADAIGRLERGLTIGLESDPSLISLPRLLQSFAKVQKPTPGRTRVRVEPAPPAVTELVEQMSRQSAVDPGRLTSAEPLLVWEYPYFAISPGGMLLFTISYVDTNCVHVYVRDMNWESCDDC